MKNIKWYRGVMKMVGFVGVVMGLVLTLGANCVLADTGNILANPGAEDGMNHWTTHGTNFATRGSNEPHSGSRLFYGGDNNGLSIASQYVDVSAYAEAIDDINGSQVWASFSGWFKNWNNEDWGIFEMIFRDADYNEKEYHHTGWQSHNYWKQYYINDKHLPAGTRIIEIRMQAQWRAGSVNDAFFDDLSLTLKSPELEVINPPVVRLYEAIDYNANYPGKPLMVTEDNSNLGDYGFNDIISSIKVPSGRKAILYEHTNYGGVSLPKTSDDSTLVNDNFNDKALSIKVENCGFAFGDVYLCTNDSTKNYNKLKKQILKFKNTGSPDTKLRWEIGISLPESDWMKCSKSSGYLEGGKTEEIDIWLEPNEITGGPGSYNGRFRLSTRRGTAWIKFSSTAYRATQLSFVGPAKGPNGKVNVAEGESVQYEVKADGPFYPGATLPAAGYKWKIDPSNDFDPKLSDPKRSHSFSDSGDPYYVSCKSCEKANNTEVNSDPISIPVRVWKRPVMSNTPSQSAIDSGLVSWYSGNYVGVAGEPVYLMATGTKQSSDPLESIEKFIWDFDNNWNTIELEQPAGERVSHIWDKSNLSGSIRCKAVTNYGVKSIDEVFNLKIYDTIAIDTGGHTRAGQIRLLR